MEKESEKLKMGLDAQESFVQMHEDRNMNKGIGGSDDAARSCSSAGVQKRKKNKETPIPVPRMR